MILPSSNITLVMISLFSLAFMAQKKKGEEELPSVAHLILDCHRHLEASENSRARSRDAVVV